MEKQEKHNHIYRPCDRDDWIISSLKSEELNGWSFDNKYNFKVFPKENAIVMDNSLKQQVTSALAKTIYDCDNKAKYKEISLRFFKTLKDKISKNYYSKEILILIKGSNAYKYLLCDNFHEQFQWNDLDIVIFINPNINPQIFSSIKESISRLALQTISQFKRSLDHMFCFNILNTDCFLNSQIIEEFKKDYQKTLSCIKPDISNIIWYQHQQHEDYMFRVLHDIDDDVIIDLFYKKNEKKLSVMDFVWKINKDDLYEYYGKFISPFSNWRNRCSKQSFMLLPSEKLDNHLVKIEVPHFKYCECIPVIRTPIIASYNNTLFFNRTTSQNLNNNSSNNFSETSSNNNLFDGDFELHRLKINNLYLNYDKLGYLKTQDVQSDFIDLTICNQNDAILKEFWNNGKWKDVYDSDVMIDITIPDLETCINDLDKMLNVYKCPPTKRETKLKKLELLQSLMKKI